MSVCWVWPSVVRYVPTQREVPCAAARRAFCWTKTGRPVVVRKRRWEGPPGQRESRYHERCLLKNAHPHPPSLSGPVWCSNGNGWYDPKFKNNHWFQQTYIMYQCHSLKESWLVKPEERKLKLYMNSVLLVSVTEVAIKHRAKDLSLFHMQILMSVPMPTEAARRCAPTRRLATPALVSLASSWTTTEWPANVSHHTTTAYILPLPQQKS